MSSSSNLSNPQHEDPDSQLLINQEPPILYQPHPDLDPNNPVEKSEEKVQVQEITEEISLGMPAPTSVVLVSPPGRGSNKRKKGKGKAVNAKKQQVIDSKVKLLTENLNPIPFVPHKLLDFSKHKELLTKLGLWDLVNIDFDKNIRVDLLAQLVGSYTNKARCGYVNGFRIQVSRPDLARALKIPNANARRDKYNMVKKQIDLDSDELFSKDSIAFMVKFVLDWVLLHEDACIVPDEVMEWIKVIKGGHPEKVDWAGLFWLMVEKELSRGEKLEDCYYASHLQHLMKEQKVFLREEAAIVEANSSNLQYSMKEEAIVELDVKIEDGKDVIDGIEDKREENSVMDGLNIELTLGQEGEKEVGSKSAEEDGGVDEQEQLNLDWKNDKGEHFMQHCSSKHVKEYDGLEETKMEEGNKEDNGEKYQVFLKHDGLEETIMEGGNEDDGEKHHVSPNNDDLEETKMEEENKDDGEKYHVSPNNDGLEETKMEEENKEGNGEKYHVSPNYEETKMEEENKEDNREKYHVFPNHGGLEEPTVEEENEEVEDEQYHVFPDHDGLEENGLTGNFLEGMEVNQSSFDSEEQLCEMQQMDIFNRSGKRILEHDDNLILHNDGNKRLRVGDSSNHRPVDSRSYFHQIQQLVERARIEEEGKINALNQANMHEQVLYDELQKRDNAIEYLQKSTLESTKEKDDELYRRKRELYLMVNVIDGYRKAFKATQKSLDEFRQRVNLPEEPTYRDFDDGGLMLSSSEIEKIHKNQLMIIEQHIKETEKAYDAEFDVIFEKINMLNQRLNGLEDNAKDLMELYAQKKVVQIEEKANEAEEPSISSDIIMGECSTMSIVSKTEETVLEAGETLAEQEPLVLSDQIMEEPSTC